ncbi:MAG: hypothetical protein QXQ37_06695, partial [Nitrososphaerota archaeon]
MACFLVPMTIGIILTILEKMTGHRLLERLRVDILNALLLGGSAILGFEHLWHGEVVPWPPFLTAMTNPTEIPVMLHEMMTVGLALTATTTALWLSIIMLINIKTKIHITGILNNRDKRV